MDDVDQMEWNEYQRLESAIAKRKKNIEALEKGSPIIAQRNFRYVIDYTFDFLKPEDIYINVFSANPILMGSLAETPPSQIRSFIIKSEAAEGKRTHFFLKSVEMSYAIFATESGGSQTGQRFFVSPDYRRNFFDFNWRIRDTGSDREWQNAPLPSQLLMTGNVNPLLLGNGHCLLSGGTEVIVEVIPTFSGNLEVLLSGNAEEPGFPAVNNIKSHFLQLCFVGVEVFL